MLEQVWARPGEPLTAHTEQVLARVLDLLHLKRFADYPHLRRRLFWAALLHDSGKLAKGFQRGLRSRKARWGLRHEVLSLGFLAWSGLAEEDRAWVAAAIVTHHHDLTYIGRYYRPLASQNQDIFALLIAELDSAIVKAWYDWLQSMLPRWSEHFALPEMRLLPYCAVTSTDIAGLLESVFEWVGPIFEQGLAHAATVEALLLRGLLIQADHIAAAQVSAIKPLTLDIPPLYSLYPHQQACQAVRGHTLVVAPTGSGKTEAALLWVQTQQATRLFYLLPYRASLNAMSQRLEAFAPPEDIGLQHGRALQNRYQHWLEQGYSPDEANNKARDQLRLARLHTYPVTLFSPYHLLLALYRIKGSEALLAHCAEGCFIVDEIHAYDPQRLALIIHSLQLLQRHLGAHLLVMTATLPTLLETVLQQSLGPLTLIEADLATFRHFQRHRLIVETGQLEQALETIYHKALAGQAILVVVNTVKRAIGIAAQLQALGAEVWLLHGRFTGRDRWEQEKRIMGYFGVGNHRLEGIQPIVVSTQVIEVSLNLDFDTLYSDPAPLDALIQRFGRVNRARSLAALAEVHVFESPTGREERWPIYDIDLVEASLAILQTQHSQPINEALYKTWLDQIYAEERASHWLQRYEDRTRLVEQAVLTEFHPFEEADDALKMLFRALFDECLVLPLELEADYTTLEATDPIAASLLLVSLSYRQYKMLEQRKQAWYEGDSDLFFVDRPYSPTLGLRLEDDMEE